MVGKRKYLIVVEPPTSRPTPARTHRRSVAPPCRRPPRAQVGDCRPHVAEALIVADRDGAAPRRPLVDVASSSDPVPARHGATTESEYAAIAINPVSRRVTITSASAPAPATRPAVVASVCERHSRPPRCPQVAAQLDERRVLAQLLVQPSRPPSQVRAPRARASATNAYSCSSLTALRNGRGTVTRSYEGFPRPALPLHRPFVGATRARRRRRRQIVAGTLLGCLARARQANSRDRGGQVESRAGSWCRHGAVVGLGRQHAALFAQEGAKVVVNDLEGAATARARDRRWPTRSSPRSPSGGEAVPATTTRKPSRASAVIQTALDAFGQIAVVGQRRHPARQVFTRWTPSSGTPCCGAPVRRVQRHAGGVAAHACAAVRRVIVTTSKRWWSVRNFGQANYGAAKMGLVLPDHTHASRVCATNVTPKPSRRWPTPG